MKKVFFILILVAICNIKLFAIGTDSCDITGNFDETITINNNIILDATATIRGNVAITGNDISGNIIGQIQLEDSIIGTLTGTITGFIIDTLTKTYTGVVMGYSTGINVDNGQITGNVKGIVTGIVTCITEEEEEENNKSCREGLKCNQDECYCIKVCKTPNRELETECIKNIDEIEAGTYPSIIPLEYMPLGIDFEYSTFPGANDYYEPIVMDKEGIEEDIEDALKKWYCLCDFDKIEYKKKIKAGFSEDKEIFEWSARQTAGYARTRITAGCTVNVDASDILFNNTSYFRYQEQDEEQTESEKKWSFINRKYEDLLPDIAVPGMGKRFISFNNVVTHEFGHVLGFAHPRDCGKDEPESIMYHTTKVNVPSNELSDYDKCMFMTFYCPGLGIEEKIERPNIVITPNPTSKDVNVSFEIKEGNRLVSIQLYNEQGQILEILLSETMYSEGTHFCNTKIDFPTGMYFIQIKIDNNIYYEKIIIAK